MTRLRELLAETQFDILRVDLGDVVLPLVANLFDDWQAMNVGAIQVIAGAPAQVPSVLSAQEGGGSDGDLRDLLGVFLHVGAQLQAAAHLGASHTAVVLHTHRAVGVGARRALVDLGRDYLEAAELIWGARVPSASVGPLKVVSQRLLEQLPTS